MRGRKFILVCDQYSSKNPHTQKKTSFFFFWLTKLTLASPIIYFPFFFFWLKILYDTKKTEWNREPHITQSTKRHSIYFPIVSFSKTSYIFFFSHVHGSTYFYFLSTWTNLIIYNVSNALKFSWLMSEILKTHTHASLCLQ